MMALPATTSGTGAGATTGPAIDASNYRKFYTITAELRETYDTNVNTTSSNNQSSLETSISPSVLVDFPNENNDFSASYTFSATYYSTNNSGNISGNNSGRINGSGSFTDNLQTSNQFVAQLRHDFSEKYTVSAAEQLIDSTEPNLFGSTGTPFRDGENISNAFNANLSSQWTPLFGTQTTYANTVVHYLDNDVGDSQDSIENTGSQSFNFSVLPKISVNFGGVADDITYDDVARGYTSLTAFIGGSWQILPSLSVTARGGGSYTISKESVAGNGSASISPYGSLSLSWQIGERSSLSFNYDHEITPSDQVGANGQQSDRATANFNYIITSYLSSHLQGIYTYSEITDSLINTSSLTAYTESSYALDTGLSYHFNKYFDLNFDITISGVSSQLAERNYSRDEFSIGVRGTY